MLVVSSAAATATLRGHHGNCQVGKVEGNAMYEEVAAAAEGNEFIPDLWDGNSSLLLEGIDIDDLFAVGIDFLPDLEMDPSEIQADFSPVIDDSDGANTDDFITVKRPREEEVPGSGSSRSGQEGCSNLSNKGGEDTRGSASPSSSSVVLNPPAPVTKNIRGGEKARRKSTTTAQGIDSKNNNHGKRKVKVDWTPELHRRFVQAVEQLGVDKAVPSRILELMGIDCLTRHNVASHLQKYRSHRKHLLAREAEAVSWNQRRQVYGGDGAAAGGKRDHHKHAWQQAPIMGFPPPLTPPPPPPMHHLIRPLHVWGHPSMGGQPVIHIWPKHIPHHQHPTWTPPPPTAAAADTSYWHHQRVPVAAAGIGQSPGIRCNIPQQLLPQTRSLATAVPGIPPPPHSMYKTEAAAMGRQPQSGSSPSHLFDIQPSKESIDAAIGDVLSYPWLPLPLGLKPPAVDSVLMELQRQGIPHIPPATSS